MFIVICINEGKYTQTRSRPFETRQEAERYVTTISPTRNPIIVNIDGDKTIWTKSQLENFLRQETSMMDDACKRLASTLYNKDIANLLIRSNPEDYTERSE